MGFGKKSGPIKPVFKNPQLLGRMEVMLAVRHDLEAAGKPAGKGFDGAAPAGVVPAAVQDLSRRRPFADRVLNHIGIVVPVQGLADGGGDGLLASQLLLGNPKSDHHVLDHAPHIHQRRQKPCLFQGLAGIGHEAEIRADAVCEQADRLPPGPGPAHDRGQLRHARLHLAEGRLIPAVSVLWEVKAQNLTAAGHVIGVFGQYADGLIGLVGLAAVNSDDDPVRRTALKQGGDVLNFQAFYSHGLRSSLFLAASPPDRASRSACS